MKVLRLAACILPLLALAGHVQAAKPLKSVAATSTKSSEAALRRLLVKDIVTHWGPYVRQQHGEDIRAWADRLVPTFRTAELQKLQQAAAADSFQEMMNALIGQRAMQTTTLQGLKPAALLGSDVGDLVFTPLPSCILLDTRVVGGIFTAGAIRHYKASGPDFVAQGGSNTNCGIPANVSTLLVSIQSVNATAKGYFRIWPYSTTMPAASSLSYGTGSNAQNEIIQKVSQGLTQDFSVQSSAGSHLVVNVLGYFAAPAATALDCQSVEDNSQTVAANAVNAIVSGNTCPAGYSLTGVNCWGSNPTVTSIGSGLSGSTYFCRYTSTSASVQQVFTYQRCCRIPGR